MKKITDILFSALIFLALLLPSLYFIGVKENFARPLYGAERSPKPVSLTVANFVSRKFQKTFDEIFGKEFFLRKSYFRCKNQIYALFNFGYFFSGSGVPIYGSRDGWLQGHSYMEYYYGNYRIDEKKYRNCFQLFEKLAKEFKRRNIDFIYVLATDKIFMYPERMSPLFSYYLRGKDGPTPYAQFAGILQKYNVPCLDSHAYLSQFRNQIELFPRTGIHWNAYAACMTVEEMLRRINKNKSASEQYIVPVPVRYEKTTHPVYCENDVGSLCNLIWEPENVGSLPVFDSNGKKNMCDVIVLGDSYSEEISQALRHSRCFGQIINYSNRIPPEANFYKWLAGTKLFVLVYTTHKLYNPMGRHDDLQKIYDMLRRYPGPKPLPLGKKVLFNDLEDYMSAGFFGRESVGRWASRECTLKLPVPAEAVKKPIRLTFTGSPLSPDQSVIVKNRQDQVLTTLALPAKGRYQVEIPAGNIKEDRFLILDLQFPQARKPGNPRDPRILSFKFQDLELESLPGK